MSDKEHIKQLEAEGPACTGACERCKLKIRTMEYHDPDGLFCEPCHHLNEAAGLLQKAANDFMPNNGKEVKWVKDARAFLARSKS